MESKINKKMPVIMTAISFVAFIPIYLLLTVYSVIPQYFKGLIFLVPTVTFLIITVLNKKNILKYSASITVIIALTIIYILIAFPILMIFGFEEATTIVTDISRYERVLSYVAFPRKNS